MPECQGHTLHSTFFMKVGVPFLKAEEINFGPYSKLIYVSTNIETVQSFRTVEHCNRGVFVLLSFKEMSYSWSAMKGIHLSYI